MREMGMKANLIKCIIKEAIAKVRADYEKNGKDLPNLRNREICQEIAREIGREAMFGAKRLRVLKKEQSLVSFATIVTSLLATVLCKNTQENNSLTTPSWPLPKHWEEITKQVLEKIKKKGGKND